MRLLKLNMDYCNKGISKHLAKGLEVAQVLHSGELVEAVEAEGRPRNSGFPAGFVSSVAGAVTSPQRRLWALEIEQPLENSQTIKHEEQDLRDKHYTYSQRHVGLSTHREGAKVLKRDLIATSAIGAEKITNRFVD